MIRENTFFRLLGAALLAVVVCGSTPSCVTSRDAHAARAVARPTMADARRWLAQSRSLSRTLEVRLGLALAAARHACEAASHADNTEAAAIYGQACDEVAALAARLSLPLTVPTPTGPCPVAYQSGSDSGLWPPGYFSQLVPADSIPNRRLRHSLPGWGGTLVGVRSRKASRQKFSPPRGITAPVTAVVRFSPEGATLALYDPTRTKTVTIDGKKRQLAANFGAPFGYFPTIGRDGIVAMLRPNLLSDRQGLFLVQPYDEHKIPILFVHGLMALPQMWAPVMAAIEADPELRGKFQFWVFAYPTGNPIAYSSLRLQDALRDLYAAYPRSRDLVVVNHSLGGVLTHLQVISPGDALVTGIFGENAPRVLAMRDDALVKRALLVAANPHIQRVVFIAVPHRGAPMAMRLIGNLGSTLIRLPVRLLGALGDTTLETVRLATGSRTARIPNAINGLSPRSPLLRAMNSVPIEVPFHSIIGVAGWPRRPLERTSDTVVPYWSSHLDGAVSETIVPAPHTTIFEHPEAIAEIKRALKLELARRNAAR